MIKHFSSVYVLPLSKLHSLYILCLETPVTKCTVIKEKITGFTNLLVLRKTNQNYVHFLNFFQLTKVTINFKKYPQLNYVKSKIRSFSPFQNNPVGQVITSDRLFVEIFFYEMVLTKGSKFRQAQPINQKFKFKILIYPGLCW